MNGITKYCWLIGLAAIFGLSNAAYAACSFDLNANPAPEGADDLSGQGNFTCADFIGADGDPMTELISVTFSNVVQPDGSTTGTWDFPDGPEKMKVNGLVINTPDKIVLRPQGQGTRCTFSYTKINAEFGTDLGIDGNIDINDSVACTDEEVNNEEIVQPEPDIVLTGDSCVVTLLEGTENITSNFDVITATNIEGDKNAICSANPNVGQNECVRGCPKFIDVDALQAAGFCEAVDGLIPLTDPTIGSPTNNPLNRCTPCLTVAQAKGDPEFPGFDTGFAEDGITPLRLCWAWVNRVNEDDVTNLVIPPGFYKPHKQVRDQTTQTVLYNECYTTTTTINFFGREITKTVTTCD